MRISEGSHLQLIRGGYPRFTWAFHDNEEIGPKMLSRIAKLTGLKVGDSQYSIRFWREGEKTRHEVLMGDPALVQIRRYGDTFA